MPRGVYNRKKKRATKVVKSVTITKRAKSVRGAEMLDLVLRSITETFHDDPTIPGISLAYMPGDKNYYGSIVRFHEAYGRDRVAVHHVRGESAFAVLEALINIWKDKIKSSSEATERLRRL